MLTWGVSALVPFTWARPVVAPRVLWYMAAWFMGFMEDDMKSLRYRASAIRACSKVTALVPWLHP